MKIYYQVMMSLNVVLMLVCGLLYPYYAIQEDKKQYFLYAVLFVIILMLDYRKNRRKLSQIASVVR
ncbi:hypothetical protein [Paenibacillus xylanexedens]|uniref:hypothetical protein n=1 Tax=Paenibacillus xylanexedens TaxID=528191 RepID=UPI0011A55893|nr:hypothetical protein [Paenibacillus xylanexedens]